MKKLTVVLFVIAGLCIAFFAVKKQRSTDEKQAFLRTKTVIPSAAEQTPVLPEDSNGGTESTVLTSLISLQAGEIPIAAHSVDFDGDGYEDQLIALKTPANRFIQVIAGVYNPVTNKYERSAHIKTDMEQVKTFSLSAMDITGTHENALIITGYSAQDEFRLQAWLPVKNGSALSLHKIADFSAEGTIFIQQKKRSDSYPMETAAGESFPIWVYTSDSEAPSGSLNQLQIMYDWDTAQKIYVKKIEKKITQKSVNMQELSKIQDGTEQTFGLFLNGLWAKSGESEHNNRSLFFDYENKEIIFFQPDRQEIYAWERSTLRRNGILVYTTNRSMPNISRRFDIVLVSVDEIRIKIVDDLGMLINSDTLWDGNYKKQNIDTFFPPQTSSATEETDIIKLLQTDRRTIWKCDNGWEISCSGNVYTAKNGNLTESGVFSPLRIFGENLLQFKSRMQNSVFSGFYRVEIITAPQTGSRENEAEAAEKTLAGTRIILSPVTVSISQAGNALSRSLQMELSAVKNE